MEDKKVDLSKYKNSFSVKNRMVRMLWTIVWTILAKPFPRSIGNSWKLLLLRIFGAKIHSKAVVYSSVKIYMPWNLEMDAYSCLAPEVDCYNVDKIKIGANATVSQRTYLCTASHDISLPSNPLIHAPIIVCEQAWVGAEAYIGMGVTIGQGVVVGARACVYKDVEPWTIVGGNPAKFIKNRIIKDE